VAERLGSTPPGRGAEAGEAAAEADLAAEGQPAGVRQQGRTAAAVAIMLEATSARKGRFYFSSVPQPESRDFFSLKLLNSPHNLSPSSNIEQEKMKKK
jgi:hypothetical protein